MATPLEKWVDEQARLFEPKHVYWCDGSEGEARRIIEMGMKEERIGLHGIFREATGPNNNWKDPKDAKELMTRLSRGAMRGKTMYVLPYMMGHPDSPYAKACVQVTDVSYVAVSMRIMTRMSKKVIEKIGKSEDFVKGLHSVGDFDPNKRFIMHFPDEHLVWSIGSGYGGNALLGKKCFSLRI